MPQVKGAITHITAEATYGQTRKRSVVILTDEKYPQTLAVDFINDRINMIANLGVGQVVEIDVNIQGREWTSPQGETKYFTSLSGWRIAVVEAPAKVAEQVDEDKPF
jgi:hypothetical protein